jgi:hypothetical protein
VFHFSNQFLDQKLFNREHLVSWSIVMVEISILLLAQSSGLFYKWLHITTSIFPHNKLDGMVDLVE